MPPPDHDWNPTAASIPLVKPGVTFLDETLRDGIQNPSVHDPGIDDKFELVRLMDEIGIDYVNVGIPAASQRSADDAVEMTRRIVSSKLKIRPVAAGRTVVNDLVPIVDIAATLGEPLEVYTFIGSSPIRQLVENWDVPWLVKKSAEAIDFAVKEGMRVCYVTEDTTRSRPETLTTLWQNALDHGASRICLTDTVGYATPAGVENLIRFARVVTSAAGRPEVGLDWHGHNDRGLALDNALNALEHGVDRVHATALGIGERCGNVSMELLLHNLQRRGEFPTATADRLKRFCESAAKAMNWSIPAHYPVIGDDVDAPVHAATDQDVGRVSA